MFHVYVAHFIYLAATSCEELAHWKRLWCWEGLGAGGEGDDRGWDGWMASLTQWTWVWANSGSWWWTGRPGVLRFMGSQRVGHNWATELNWTEGLARVRGSGSNYLPTILRVLQYFRCRSWILALLPYVSISLKWESWAERQTSRRREPLLWWASACANSRWLWCSPLKTFLNQQAES